MFELFDPQEETRISQGGHLPHWHQSGVSYFITFRTEDSIPADVSKRWHAARADWMSRHGINPRADKFQSQLAALPARLRREYHERFSQEYMEYLDKGLGACELRDSQLAMIVANSLMHHDSERYHLGAFVVMPNHVHVVACLLGQTEIEDQCYSWKKYTATRINRALGRRGRFWQEESFDHLIRSPEQFDAVERYILNNPRHLRPGEYCLHQRAQ